MDIFGTPTKGRQSIFVGSIVMQPKVPRNLLEILLIQGSRPLFSAIRDLARTHLGCRQFWDSLLKLSSGLASTVSSISHAPEIPLLSQFSIYLGQHQIRHNLGGAFQRFSRYPSGPHSPLSVQTLYLSDSSPYIRLNKQPVRFTSNASVTLNTDNGVARFCLDKPVGKDDKKKGKKMPKRLKMSRKAKISELRFYRLKAKKKMTSPNPEVRIRYKLEKAKRKEEWLIEKLRKFESPKAPEQAYDPEILTEEERFYLKRTGEKKKNYCPVGRRGVFGGVVLNMHLHWKKHETVKVICKPCKPGQVHEYAEELARLSKGIVIDIKANNTILFYRGKNYIQPEVMSPPDTLSKYKALEKYKFEQSLEHTSQFIEKLEKELEDYHKHIALYKKGQQVPCENATA